MRSEIQKRLPKEWGEEEVAQLTEIWEVVKNDIGKFIHKIVHDFGKKKNKNNNNCDKFFLNFSLLFFL